MINKLSPSLLAADMTILAEEVEAVSAGGAAMLHLDIMDGHFVPNLSYGPHICACLHRRFDVPLDVHLMVEKPSLFVRPFLKAGAAAVNLHVETETEEILKELLREIREAGAKAAVTVKPKTPVEAIEPYLALIDMVLVMTVEPGYGGQSFLPGSLERIRAVRSRLDIANPGCDLEVDGGVTLENCPECLDAGANVIVAGSSVFGAPDRRARTEEFMRVLKGQRKSN